MCITVAIQYEGGQMRKKYIEAYEAIIMAEKEIMLAKQELVRGDSPYVSLSVAKNHCSTAMKLWHTAKGYDVDKT